MAYIIAHYRRPCPRLSPILAPRRPQKRPGQGSTRRKARHLEECCRGVGICTGGGRQDKSVAVVRFFCPSDQRLTAFSPEGPAGSLWEFANDINAICAIHRCLRAVRSRRKLDGKGKGRMAAGRMSLKRLRFLESRRTLPAGASGRKLNDINAPSAIRLSGGPEAPSLACVASV